MCSKRSTRNDETGALAIDPAIPLKAIQFAYSRRILSSRRIAQCCEENVVFMASVADTRPHFTTIADFISSMEEQIISVFRDAVTTSSSDDFHGFASTAWITFGWLDQCSSWPS